MKNIMKTHTTIEKKRIIILGRQNAVDLLKRYGFLLGECPICDVQFKVPGGGD